MQACLRAGIHQDTSLGHRSMSCKASINTSCCARAHLLVMLKREVAEDVHFCIVMCNLEREGGMHVLIDALVVVHKSLAVLRADQKVVVHAGMA